MNFIFALAYFTTMQTWIGHSLSISKHSSRLSKSRLLSVPSSHQKTNKLKSEISSNITSKEFIITQRLTDYNAWYSDVISAADMADSSPVRGCMVIRPWGMAIWDLIHSELDFRIKQQDVSNAYFPLLIPQSFLTKEAEHVEGFAKECAIVTHHRLCNSPDGKGLIPDPEAKLEEPLIIRPTSESVIWHMFSKWIQSHRDLPLKINQWANVVRWEMRTRPFLRSSEFLWQEGHTAHATREEALQQSKDILNMYYDFCKEFLAIPCIRGRKSPSERFAGADETFTIEALMQNGWALQSGTSHFLGQNFARAFDVYFQTQSQTSELVWATSWGVSTRLIGAMVMTHSDDKGLILPPKVAPIQVVIIPITKEKDEKNQILLDKVQEIRIALLEAGIRVKVDSRDNMRPGSKYYEWERKGVPIRLDLGLRDLNQNKATITIRNKVDSKLTVDLNIHHLVATITETLKNIHNQLLESAQNRLTERTFSITKYAELLAAINSNSESEKGFYLVPWYCNKENEAAIKEDCKATIRCYPEDLNPLDKNLELKCFYSGKPATHMAIFARSY